MADSGSKIVVHYRPKAPEAGSYRPGDLWFDGSVMHLFRGVRRPGWYVFDGTTWHPYSTAKAASDERPRIKRRNPTSGAS